MSSFDLLFQQLITFSCSITGVTSIAAVGLAVDPEAVKEAQEATGAALGLLSDLFPAIISVLHGSIDACSMLMAPFLSAYIQRLKRFDPIFTQCLSRLLRFKLLPPGMCMGCVFYRRLLY